MNELRKSACMVLMACLFLADYRGVIVGLLLLVYFWDRLSRLAREAHLDVLAWRFDAQGSAGYPGTARVAYRRLVEWRSR